MGAEVARGKLNMGFAGKTRGTISRGRLDVHSSYSRPDGARRLRYAVIARQALEMQGVEFSLASGLLGRAGFLSMLLLLLLALCVRCGHRSLETLGCRVPQNVIHRR
jgi:hypothetical protein